MRHSQNRMLRCVLMLFIACLFISSSFAQDKSKKEKTPEPPFEVKLNVTALDAKGSPVKDLRAEDFQVSEDGVTQQVKHVSQKEGPPIFGIVADNSGSLRHVINKVVDFGAALVESSDPGSEIFIERFVGSDRIMLMRDFTTDKAALGRALDDMYVEGGQTAITYALHFAAEHMAKRRDDGQPPRRRALVLITDGEDRDRSHNLEPLIAKLREADIQVFVLGLTKFVELQRSSPERAIAYLNRLALESGGALYLPEKNVINIAPFAKEILAEMNAPYTIGYTPTNQKRDRTPRKLSVTVANGPDGEPRRVIVRSDYISPRK